jgi:uncharacterized membrane protein
MTTLRTLVLVLATLSMGLAAGLFYTFQVVVMRGLAVTDDRTFVATMQAINVKILNVWFALSFGFALPLAILAAVLLIGRPGPLAWTVAAAVLYAAVIVVTAVRNIPMNNALDAAGDHDPAATRRAFEKPWVRWNLARTWLSLAAFACLVLAVLRVD